jgi:hypothetical protein
MQEQPRDVAIQLLYWLCRIGIATGRLAFLNLEPAAWMAKGGLERIESSVIRSSAPIPEVPDVDDPKPSPVQIGSLAAIKS